MDAVLLELALESEPETAALRALDDATPATDFIGNLWQSAGGNAGASEEHPSPLDS